MEEIWKDIPNYEGLYQASNLGRIRSLPRNTKNQYKNGVILSQVLNHKGYYMVGLYKNTKCKRLLVNRLIALTFLPNPDNLPQVNHKDENPKNNFVDNLEWCTRVYNMNYGSQKERAHQKTRKKINQYTLEGDFVKQWGSINEAKIFYRTSHIAECCLGKRRNAKGYIWRYANE